MKTNTSKLHLALLDDKRKKVLDMLPKVSKQAVLGGGTAIALQLGHRKSYDFGMFEVRLFIKL